MRPVSPLFLAAFVFSATFLCRGFQQTQPSKAILTSAHRGEHLQHPENSLPAIQAAIEAGMDFVELDIRTTSDGRLILMHDRTVDRMTNGKGTVESMTFADIRKLDLGARFPGRFPDLQIPTFDEALALAKGKIGIYVDTKSAAPKDLVDAIDRHEMGAHVMFWSEQPDFLKQISELRPGWILMPQAFNPENVRTLIALLRPQMLGFDQRDFKPPTIAAAKKGGAGIFVDLQTPQEWQAAIDYGVAGIQTDHPFELTKFLREKGYHR